LVKRQLKYFEAKHGDWVRIGGGGGRWRGIGRESVC